MIELQQTDEYGVTYCTDTFLTIADAKDALWNLECALDDSTSSAQSYRLQALIADLRQQIEEEESDAG
jgi:hypothetical protein